MLRPVTLSTPFISLYPWFSPRSLLFLTSVVPTRSKAQCFLCHGAPTVGKRPFHACPSHSQESFHSPHFAFKCLRLSQEAVRRCKATNRHLKCKSRSAVSTNCLRRLAAFLRDVAGRQKPQIFQRSNSAEWETNSSLFQFQSFLWEVNNLSWENCLCYSFLSWFECLGGSEIENVHHVWM